jgi:thiol:disulfide interchange protein DsbD
MNPVLRPALTLLCFICSFAQTQAQMVQDPTTWSYEVKKKSHGKYDLIFHLKLKEHWHIWSIDPGGDGMQLPPVFSIKPSATVKLLGNIRENGQKISGTMDGIDGTVYYYQGQIDYIQSIAVTSNVKITGKHEYQVCDDAMCLPPRNKDFTFDITDADTTQAAASAAAPANTGTGSSTATISPSAAQPVVPEKPVAIPKHKAASKSLLMIILGGLGAGLAAVVTPCIYSMIPITVSFFTKKSKSRKQGIINALVYSVSIIFIFAALGMLIVGLFGGNALNNLATNWIANLFFFAVFLLFAISFLGAFELTLPASWTTKIDAKAGVNTYSGIFFMALTLVIVSFSCTSAFIGGIAVLAAKGGFWGPLAGFAGFGLGIALPFAVFALFPSYLKNLEKPGGWQNAVKVTLGFLELALALKFLSNADLAQGWRLLDREIFIAIWVVLAILLGLYLLGKLRFSHDDELPKNMFGIPFLSVPRLTLAIVVFSFAAYLLPGMWGAPLKAVSAFLPTMGTQDFIAGGGNNIPAGADGATRPVKYVDKLKIYEPEAAVKYGLVTYYDLDEAKAAAKKLKKPIMLDFTGINCVNCRKMEAQVWSSPEVMTRLKNDFVIVSLYCDFDKEALPQAEQYESKILGARVVTVGDKNEDYQATRFNSNTQPYYFFIDQEDRLLAPEGYPYNPNIARFMAHLDQVTARYKELNKE